MLGSALTAGCAIITYKNTPDHVWTQHPISSETLTVKRSGEHLLMQSFSIQNNGITFPKGVSLKGYTFTEGKYLQVDQSEHGTVYQPVNDFDGGGQVLQWGFYEPAKAILIDSKNRLCVQTQSSTRCVSDHNANQTKIETLSKKSLQQILRFKSIDDTKLELSYREYMGESNHPRVKDEIEINLSESQLIEYRGARIQIIEATNQHIEYKVLSSFNRPE